MGPVFVVMASELALVGLGELVAVAPGRCSQPRRAAPAEAAVGARGPAQLSIEVPRCATHFWGWRWVGRDLPVPREEET